MSFAYDGPVTSSQTPTTWAAVPLTDQPAFDWWFNTNSNGATDAPANDDERSSQARSRVPKSFTNARVSARPGGRPCTSSTPRKRSVRWLRRRCTPAIRVAPCKRSRPPDQRDSRRALPHSYAVAPLGGGIAPITVDADDTTVPTCTCSIFTLRTLRISNKKVFDESAPFEAIGHTVLMVGHFQYNGCEWIVIQDNDHTTPRYIGHSTPRARAFRAGLRPPPLIASFVVGDTARRLAAAALAAAAAALAAAARRRRPRRRRRAPPPPPPPPPTPACLASCDVGAYARDV